MLHQGISGTAKHEGYAHMPGSHNKNGYETYSRGSGALNKYQGNMVFIGLQPILFLFANWVQVGTPRLVSVIVITLETY